MPGRRGFWIPYTVLDYPTLIHLCAVPRTNSASMLYLCKTAGYMISRDSVGPWHRRCRSLRGDPTTGPPYALVCGFMPRKEDPNGHQLE
jgi:hypothetical protein